MKRGNWQPSDFGVEIDKRKFIKKIMADFYELREDMSIDEMLLHPREALSFCDYVRRKHQCPTMPDDVILRAVINQRKNKPTKT